MMLSKCLPVPALSLQIQIKAECLGVRERRPRTRAWLIFLFSCQPLFEEWVLNLDVLLKPAFERGGGGWGSKKRAETKQKRKGMWSVAGSAAGLNGTCHRMINDLRCPSIPAAVSQGGVINLHRCLVRSGRRAGEEEENRTSGRLGSRWDEQGPNNAAASVLSAEGLVCIIYYDLPRQPPPVRWEEDLRMCRQMGSGPWLPAALCPSQSETRRGPATNRGSGASITA